MRYLLALDQGTTSTRAIAVGPDGRIVAESARPLPQIYPQPGWVEHDPEIIWDSVRAVLDEAGRGLDIAALGIANQRETTVLWDRATGRAVANAIVWQDRRTARSCAELEAEGHGALVTQRTGLLLDPYFSATKLAWLLDTHNLRARAEAGELAFGTIDSFLIWRLTGGRVHVTDTTNAARTLLFDIHRNDWDDELLALFGIPRALLPAITDSSGLIATTDSGLPITGVAGDQQAAATGQGNWHPGAVKATFGTGCFLMVHTGDVARASRNRLLTTPAYRIAGRTSFAMEGSIFIAGAAIQWLRDGLRLFADAGETASLAEAASSQSGVYLVPAFAGLGAPYWDAEARGAIVGLTRDTGIAEIVRAGLEAVCFQTRDLVEALKADGVPKLGALRVDGGMAANGWAMQFLADMLDVPVERPAITESTALGAAYLAGLGAGIWSSPEETAALWRLDRRFEPAMSADERATRYDGWRRAVERVRSAVKG